MANLSQFYAGNGNLASKQLPPSQLGLAGYFAANGTPTTPSAPVSPDTTNRTLPWLQRIGGGTVTIPDDMLAPPRPSGNPFGMNWGVPLAHSDPSTAATTDSTYRSTNMPSFSDALAQAGNKPPTTATTSSPTRMLPITGFGPNRGPNDNYPPPMYPGYQDQFTNVGAGPVSFAGYAPTAQQGAATRAVAGLNAATGAAPTYDFSKMTPADFANAYMSPNAPRYALRQAFAMSGLGNPRDAAGAAYLDQVNKLAASGINPQTLPNGSLPQGYLRSLLYALYPQDYETDRYGVGAPSP